MLAACVAENDIPCRGRRPNRKMSHQERRVKVRLGRTRRWTVLPGALAAADVDRADLRRPTARLEREMRNTANRVGKSRAAFG